MQVESSPRWGATTKLVVALVFLALVALVAQRFGELFAPIIVALMFAYILNPPVTFIAARLKVSRALAVGLVYVGLIAAFAGLSTALGFAIQRQIVRFDENFSIVQILSDLPDQLDQIIHGRVVAGPFTVNFDPATAAQAVATPFYFDLSPYDLTPLYQQAVESVRPLFSQAGRVVGDFASAAASTIGWTLFVLVIGFYMLVDAPKLGQSVQDAAFPGYESDMRRLLQELNLIWSAFLRGQLVLAIVIFAVTTVIMMILGLRNAIIVGLIAGALEFLPIVGPVIAGAVGVAVALFQQTNPFGLSTLGYVVVVLVAFLVIQQLENNVLVPRIIGDSLNLHALAVLIVAVMGASFAGVLGLLLAAPTLATLRLLGRYAYRKFFDLDPWPEPMPQREANRPSIFRRLYRRFRPEPRPEPPADLHRAEYSYRVFWMKTAREWDSDRREIVSVAVAEVLARPDFEPTAYERRYAISGLDEQAHAGQSLIALQKVLEALRADSAPPAEPGLATEA